MPEKKEEVTPTGPVEKALQRYQPQKYNVLTPIISIDRLPEMSRLSVRVVQADTNDSAGDCYHSPLFMGKNERAPTKVLLDKIAAAAGISWVQSRRVDDGSDPHYCMWEAIAELVDFDGTKRRVIRSKSVDLRDGAEAVKKMPSKMLAQQRGQIVELAESKTCNRVIRSALSMKQKFTLEELKRPFVIPRLVPDMDMDDPTVKAAVVAQRLGVERQLFGPPAPPVIDAEVEVITPELLSPGELPEDSERRGSDPAGVPSSSFPGDSSDTPTVVCACTECDDGGCQTDLSDRPDIVAYTIEKYSLALCASCCAASQTYDKDAHEGGG